MRPFPRTRSSAASVRARVQAVVACTTLLVAGVALVAPEAHADDLHRKQRHAHGQVRSAQGDLDESSRALHAAATRVAAARAALGAAQRRLDAAQQQVDVAAAADAAKQVELQAAEEKLTAATAAVEAARVRVAAQREAIGRLAATNYASGDPALMGLSAVLNSHDPTDVTSQLNTVDSLMSRETSTLDSLKSARAALAAEVARVEAAKVVVAAQRKQARETLVAKQGLEQVAEDARAEVATQVARSRAAEARAARARRADAVQLRRARQQEARVRQLILQRARRQHGGYAGRVGSLLYPPVPGYVTSPYGWRKHPIFGYWGLHDGTDFHAPCGTPERASRAGTVISEQWSEVYGHRLYLDLGQVNGKNMTVVYNHLASYAVGTGQRVARGQTIGLAGTTGWSTACHLHFTVLLNGSPVDPMSYM